MSLATIEQTSSRTQFSNTLAPTIYRLREDEAATITALGEQVRRNALDDAEAFCVKARSLARRIPDRLADAMTKFSDVGSDSGILVVSGLEVGPVPPTPLNNQEGVGAGTKLAPQVAILAHGLGDMVMYEAEGTGHLLQDMVPNPNYMHRQSSQGSRQTLEAHTEQSFSDMRPDYVLLGCLRGDPDANTYVFSARDLVGRLTTEEINFLRRPLWTTLIDDSFHQYVPDPAQVRGPFAILAGSDDDPEIRIDQELTHGMTHGAHRLLQKVIDIYSRDRRGHTLMPGDVAFVDNTRAMHGRSAFRPRFDGTDRFIIRGFVVRDLRRTSCARRIGGRRISASLS